MRFAPPLLCPPPTLSLPTSGITSPADPAFVGTLVVSALMASTSTLVTPLVFIDAVSFVVNVSLSDISDTTFAARSTIAASSSTTIS